MAWQLVKASLINFILDMPLVLVMCGDFHTYVLEMEEVIKLIYVVTNIWKKIEI